MSGDISSVINMGALAVHQLLEKAQAKGVEVDLETATLENARLLEAVEKMSMDAMPKNVKRGVALVSDIITIFLHGAQFNEPKCLLCYNITLSFL